jgi:hypothetical protein
MAKEKTFAEKVIGFNNSLEFKGKLPKGIRIMNPFRESGAAASASAEFYRKYYNDHKPRHIILGINPGRFGAGLTGIPFTDPKRLIANCGIKYKGDPAHEPSSVFVYEVIREFGGEGSFYSRFYINSVCPLGFTLSEKNGKEVNYNYYDSKELTQAVRPFMLSNINKQLEFGVHRDVAFCFGTGKNEKFLRELNEEHEFFKEIIALEHPRFIMQYKSKHKKEYIAKYMNAFRRAQS